jgi:hypothetical protein
MATFGRHRETNEKLRVVIKLTRSDEIIHLHILLAQHLHHDLSSCTLWAVSRHVRRGPMREGAIVSIYSDVLSRILPFSIRGLGPRVEAHRPRGICHLFNTKQGERSWAREGWKNASEEKADMSHRRKRFLN